MCKPGKPRKKIRDAVVCQKNISLYPDEVEELYSDKVVLSGTVYTVRRGNVTFYPYPHH